MILFIDDSTPGGGGGGGFRYWRMLGFETPSATSIDLTEIHLYNGVSRVDASATITAAGSTTGFTVGGTAANLQDGSQATAYGATASQTYRLSDFVWFQWDAGSGNTLTVDGVQLGYKDVAANYPSRFMIQCSSDGTNWVTRKTVSGLTAPGTTLTMSSTIDVTPPTIASPFAIDYSAAEDNIFVAPSTGTYTFRMWAAGGGSNFNTSGGDMAQGGAGGFVKFDISLTAGDRVTAKVGGAGKRGISGSRRPGSGAGRTEIRIGGVLVAVAGAGAGGGGYGNSNTESWGGEGGGTSGLAGQGGATNSGGATPGLGGTSSAGGAGGTPGPGATGASLQGGDGSGTSLNNLGGWPNGGFASANSEYGGGGGDGYYGGGGGGGNGTWGNGGGGGSSYTNGSCSNVTHTRGVKNAAPATGETGYVAGIAIGGSAGTDGGNGRIVITW